MRVIRLSGNRGTTYPAHRCICHRGTQSTSAHREPIAPKPPTRNHLQRRRATCLCGRRQDHARSASAMICGRLVYLQRTANWRITRLQPAEGPRPRAAFAPCRPLIRNQGSPAQCRSGASSPCPWFRPFPCSCSSACNALWALTAFVRGTIQVRHLGR